MTAFSDHDSLAEDGGAERTEAFTQRLPRRELELVDQFRAQHGWTRQHALRVLAMRQLGEPDPAPLKQGRPPKNVRRGSRRQEVLHI